MKFRAVFAFMILVAAGADGAVVQLTPGPNAHEAIQEAFILAEPGDVLQLDEGRFEFTMQLSLDVDNVTVRGRGMDKTVLSFTSQDMGGEGLYITGDGVTLEDFAIEDTSGNAMKSNGVKNLVLRRLRAEWTGGPKSSNGAYGLYPVNSENVLIDGCVAIGASDAGIYVGQSRNVIVRKSRAEYNVAGIEIENCHGADVYENEARNNTGGVLVFDLPDLPQQRGRDVRVFHNKIENNNTANFAPAGNIVAKVPAGTGVMVMANSNVEIFENDITEHQTLNLVLCSYLATGLRIHDKNYYPYPEGIDIHHNRFGRCGYEPAGELGALAALVAGRPLPDILWDGVVNEAVLENGELPLSRRIYVRDNHKTDGELTFASLGGRATMESPLTAQVSRDLAAHAGSLPALAPIRIEGIE